MQDISAASVNSAYTALLADFPFLAQKVTGAARDLGPYEFVDYTATAISIPAATDGTPANDGAIYNIAGQRVTQGYKGIVIKNGRKYLSR